VFPLPLEEAVVHHAESEQKNQNKENRHKQKSQNSYPPWLLLHVSRQFRADRHRISLSYAGAALNALLCNASWRPPWKLARRAPSSSGIRCASYPYCFTHRNRYSLVPEIVPSLLRSIHQILSMQFTPQTQGFTAQESSSAGLVFEAFRVKTRQESRKTQFGARIHDRKGSSRFFQRRSAGPAWLMV
jgi:hypothetical protein